MADLINKGNQYIKENADKVNPEYRLTYHLMPPVGWMNDPNGFCYYKGEYHLFYQHYPYEAKWNTMHWGHAVTEDLIKWKDLEIALAPDKEYDKEGCFSGTALIEEERLNLFYTCVNKRKGEYAQEQALAYSEDGIHFVKHKNNPIIPSSLLPDDIYTGDFRDPKIFKEGDTYYCITVAKDKEDTGRALLYQSKDKINWSFVSDILPKNKDFGTMLECPDYFKLDEKAVLFFSVIDLKKDGYRFINRQSPVYMIGSYKEHFFDCEIWDEIDMGFDFYAHQTTLTKDGRRIMTAWMQAWDEAMPTSYLGHGWAGAMILPREIILKGNLLYQQPVREIKNYRQNGQTYQNLLLNEKSGILSLEGIYGKSMELNVIADMKQSDSFTIHLMKTEEEECLLTYNKKKGIIRFDREHGGEKIESVHFEKPSYREFPLELENNKLKLQIFIDTCSIEIFLQDGLRTITSVVYPKKKGYGVAFSCEGGVVLEQVEKWDIKL